MGFIAIDDDITIFINLDFTIGVPFALDRGAVNRQKLNQFQAIFTDFNGFEVLFGIEDVFVIEFKDFTLNTITCEFINSNRPSAEKIFVSFFGVELGIVLDYDIIKNCF